MGSHNNMREREWGWKGRERGRTARRKERILTLRLAAAGDGDVVVHYVILGGALIKRRRGVFQKKGRRVPRSPPLPLPPPLLFVNLDSPRYNLPPKLGSITRVPHLLTESTENLRNFLILNFPITIPQSPHYLTSQG